MLNTKEHYDLMAMFEREFQIGAERSRKESKDIWAKGHVYCHGETNAIFLAYRRGYAYGKVVFQESTP